MKASMTLKTTTLAIVAALVGLTACNRASKREMPVNPQITAEKANTHQLNITFRQVEKAYAAEDQTLAKKIEAIEAQPVWITKKVDTPAGMQDTIKAQFRFNGLLFERSPIFLLKSKTLAVSDIKNGQWIDLTSDISAETSEKLGGPLSGKASCMDEECSQVALLISVSKLTVLDGTALNKIKSDARIALTSKKATAEELTVLRTQLDAGIKMIEAGKIQPNQSDETEINAIMKLQEELDVRVFDISGKSPMEADKAAGISEITMTAGYIFKMEGDGYVLQNSVGPATSVKQAQIDRRGDK